jgi:hypothetical protein
VFSTQKFCGTEAAGVRDMQDALLDPELAAEVRARLEALKMGTATQADVDQLVMPCILSYNGDPLVARVGWRALVSSPATTFRAAHLPDIGAHVRAMVLGADDRSNQLLHLLRFSMPYIKHNRLSFVPFERVSLQLLRDLVRMQLATCIGIYNDNNKRPVWRLRVQIIAMFTQLLANGSAMDLHVFCCAHVPLVRLALIEYYIFFVTTHMPTEAGLQHRLFGSDNPATVFRQITAVIDGFRQVQFQGAALDWDEVATRAQVAVEKCNRCSKGLAKTAPPPASVPRMCLDSVLTARSLPLFSHPQHLPGFSVAALMQVQRLHNSVRKHPLPFNLTLAQVRVLKELVRHNSAQAVNAAIMHACLRCIERVPDKTIRSGPTSIVCGHCLSDEYTIAINVVGCIVSVCGRKFYMCPFCIQVHKWTGSGHEFHQCQLSTTPDARPRGCVICTHTNSINRVCVLDARLGVMQHFTLCNRHLPYEHQMAFVHDLASLVAAIQRKFRK